MAGGMSEGAMKLRTGLLAAALLASTATPALAGPFAEVGDRQLRQDVDLLKAAGLIRGPVDSWPLPWEQIEPALDDARDGRPLDPYLAAAVSRLEKLDDFARQRVTVEANVAATNQVATARDFGSEARGKFDGSIAAAYNSDIVSVQLGVGYRTGGQQVGNKFNFEPSEISVRLGNWAVYGGYTQQWFGPGHDGALLFSNSARPFPKVGIKRLMPNAIDFPVLRWLGPIRLDIFAGVLDGPRSDYRNVVTVGTRLSFAPTRGLEIGLNRAQQMCGRGRPCGFTQIKDSFIGAGNADNPTPGDINAFFRQAGNQLAGYDASYVWRMGKVSAKLYFEVAAEDFDNIILEQYGRQVGGTFSGPWGTKGASWQLNLEYADTLAAQLFNGTPLEKVFKSRRQYPGSLYQNSLYTDGFTYRARPIGYWTDGDSRNLVAAFSLTDTQNRRWYGSARKVDLNLINLGNPPRPVALPDGTNGNLQTNRVSFDKERFALLTVGAEVPTAYGDVKAEVRYQTDSPNTPGRRDRQVQFEIGYRQRF